MSAETAMLLQMRREHPPLDLLCACLRPMLDPTTAVTLSNLPNGDWTLLVQMASRLNAGAFLCHRLRPHVGRIGVPAAAWQRLRSAYHATALRNLELYQALHRILAALDDASVPVIVLKGAHLAQAVYDTVALRPMSDLDILVPCEELARVERRLTHLGLQPVPSNSDEATHHRPYVLRGDSPLLVEVHWHLQPPSYPFQIDLEQLWHRAHPFTFHGMGARVLCPEDLLLHICYHVACHHKFNGGGLKSFIDIGEIIRRFQPHLEWTTFATRARAWGVGNGVYLALQFAQTLVGADIPEEILHRLQPRPMDDRVWKWAGKRILGEVDDTVGPWSDTIGQLWSTSGIRPKSSALLRSFFPARRVVGQTYAVPPGSARVLLYYPVRWLHLLRGPAARWWRIVRRNPAARAWVEREAERNALEDWLATG